MLDNFLSYAFYWSVKSGSSYSQRSELFSHRSYGEELLPQNLFTIESHHGLCSGILHYLHP